MRWALAFLIISFALPRWAGAEQPVTQEAFATVVAAYYDRWNSTNNEIQRAEMVLERGEELIRTLRPEAAFADWIMEVAQVGIDRMGHAYIQLILPGSGPRRFAIINLAVGDSDPYGQRLPLGSPIYSLARDLNQREFVVVSGVFFASDRTGIVDASAAMNIAPARLFLTPLFAVRYTSMRRQ